jgi:hypothetical protein
MWNALNCRNLKSEDPEARDSALRGLMNAVQSQDFSVYAGDSPPEADSPKCTGMLHEDLYGALLFGLWLGWDSDADRDAVRTVPIEENEIVYAFCKLSQAGDTRIVRRNCPERVLYIDGWVQEDDPLFQSSVRFIVKAVEGDSKSWFFSPEELYRDYVFEGTDLPVGKKIPLSVKVW